MTKVLLLGVDGMDRDMLLRFEAELPNLSRLMHSGAVMEMESVQPPDSNTAWGSIHTGINPARHGIVHFTDPLERVGISNTDDLDNSTLRGRTYWDIAGRAGKGVCLIFPHLTYPGWDVNGVMVSRSAVRDEVKTYPASVGRGHDLTRLYNMPGFPKGKGFLHHYAQKGRDLIQGESELGLKLFGEGRWDIFFLYSAALDTIQHLFWVYHDPQDPTYPGKNPYEDVIKDCYRLHDAILGRFLEAAGPDTAVVLFSDHGHGMRPVKVFNINEWLRQQGLLVSRGGGLGRLSPLSLIEKSKRQALDFVIRHDLGNLALKLIVAFPWARHWYSAASSLDQNRTVAFLPDFSGIKAYAYGGIRIRREGLGERDYEEVRSQIVRGLGEVEDPEGGGRLMKWVCRKEELYPGEYLDRYPDIVFYLREDYGAGGAIHDALFGRALTHSLVPGSHRAGTAVFLAHNLGRGLARRTMSVMDIAPTVLDLLRVEGGPALDGCSILAPD